MPKPTTPGAGNPTAKQINEIIGLTQGGHPVKRICRALGITAKQLADWLQAGRAQHHGDLKDFYRDYDKAAALGEIANEELLKKHAKDNPAAAFRLIERLEQRAEKEEGDTGEPLANTKHELFCQAKATGMDARDAYKSVYGSNHKSVDSLTSRLMASSIVKNRLRELALGGVRSTHLTVAEKHLIYATEGTDKRNPLHVRLKAIRDDSELAGHIQMAEKSAVNVTVNVATLSEERRAELIARKRASVERRLRINRPETPQLSNGSNGRH